MSDYCVDVSCSQRPVPCRVLNDIGTSLLSPYHCCCLTFSDTAADRDHTIADANPLVRDRDLGEELWRLSDRWTGLTSL